MRTGAIPLKFNISSAQSQILRLASGRREAIPLAFPFGITINLLVSDDERRYARKLLVWLKDRRVLNSFECCDDCIDQALGSLQEIRTKLLAIQIELSSVDESALAAVLEFMLAPIRQFLTFVQKIEANGRKERNAHGRHQLNRELYFDALESLRGHLSRCLSQIAVVAGEPVPMNGILADYRGPWPADAYETPTQDGSGA